MKSPDRAGISIRSRARGFTLLEVMVALVITAVGLLGIAKIQALAYASTGSASLRSLVALQASSLAASMHANRNYWAFGAAPVPLTITGLTIGDATLQGDTTNCIAPAARCLPATLAAFDLHDYAQALNKMMPGSNPITTITCPALPLPISCTIQVTWGEHAVSINKESAAATVQSTSATPGTFAPTYTLYVEP
jgi:type IV pilus assembly protein PilV